MTTADVIWLLQTRFRTQLQAELFEALRARWRGQDETLQSLYQDICRLVTLAYPSAGVTLTNHVYKEAFITALSDGHLQLEVMKREPVNIEAAVSCAIKVEAYEQSLVCQGTLATDKSRVKCRSCNVYAVSDQSDAGENAILRKHIDEF